MCSNLQTIQRSRTMSVWIPDFIDDPLEAQILCLHGESLDCISQQKYTALFFLKIYRMVEELSYEELSEILEWYLPSVSISENFDAQEVATEIIESEDFYFGLPNFNKEMIECIDVELLYEKGELPDELKEAWDESGSMESLLRNNYTKINEIKCRNSEWTYDVKLSKSLMGLED